MTRLNALKLQNIFYNFKEIILQAEGSTRSVHFTLIAAYFCGNNMLTFIFTSISMHFFSFYLFLQGNR